MLKPLLLTSLISFVSILEATPKPKECPPGPKHMRAAVRHIEAGGIGYNSGYTTLEMFFAPDPTDFAVMPFFDLKGHVFNNSKGAMNAGVGVRGIHGCRTYGGNLYYDFRNTNRQFYHQLGVGFETLGSFWDLRVNGYFPVGGKVSSPYDLQFASFRGNSILVKRKYEYAMTGVDAEAGFHFGKTKNFDFYAAAGPYYFKGKMGAAAAGGKVRIAGYYKDYIALELSNSYDPVFHNNVQGQITFSLPFGPKSKTKVKENTCRNTCSMASMLNQRMLEPVGRQEIVVIDQHKKKEATSDTVFFVDNTSHSAGTFESPYPTLQEAINAAGEGDLIYIYPGDGTATGLTAVTPFVLKNNQQILGSSSPHTIATNLGTITIPQGSTLAPLISANNMTNVFEIANNNTLSALHIAVPGGANNWAIGTANNINNLTLSNSILQAQNADVILVNLGNSMGSPTGTMNFSNNYFLSGNASSYAIDGTHTGSAPLILNVTNNQFSGFDQSALSITSYSGNVLANIADNQILNVSANDYAFRFSANETAIMDLNLWNNTIVNDSALYLELYDSGQISCNLSNNTIYAANDILYFYPNNNTKLNVTATNNLFSSDASNENTILLEAYHDSETILAFSNNQIDVSCSDQPGLGFNLGTNNAATLDFSSIGNAITCAGLDNPLPISITSTGTSSVEALIENCTLYALHSDQDGKGIDSQIQENSTLNITVKNNIIQASSQGINLSGSSNTTLHAVIEGNQIEITPGGDHGVNVNIIEASTIALDCNSNSIIGPHGVNFESRSTQPLNAVCLNNSLEGISTKYVARVYIESAGTTSTTFQGNSIIGSTGINDYLVAVFANSGGSAYLDFTNNQLISGGLGILSTIEETNTQLIAHVTSNTMQTLQGDQFTADTGTPSVCIRYMNNLGNAKNEFVNNGMGTFTLYYEGNNLSYIDGGSDITPGNPTSCPFP